MKNQINFLRFLIALMLTVFVSNFSVAQTTASISTSQSATNGSIDYSITGADMTTSYTIYFESAAPSVSAGDTYTSGAGTPSEYITTDASGGASSSTSSATFSGTYYYAVLVDNNSEVVAVDTYGSSVTSATFQPASISTSQSATNGSIDYSITGADMTTSYTIYFESAAPSVSAGDTYTSGAGTPSEYITTDASGGASSSTSSATFSGTYYYAVLVDNNSEVVAVDTYGSSVISASFHRLHLNLTVSNQR